MQGSWKDIERLASVNGVITPADVRAFGLVPENLNRMASKGLLVRVGRGLYEHPEFVPTQHHSYVEIAKAVPNAVICLLSALNIHNIGTQMPWEIWITIPRNQRIPKFHQKQVRTVTMTGPYYAEAIETHVFEGIPVKVYSLEKTIVDCFRLRRLIGHEVSVEALRESIRDGRVDVSKIIEISDRLRTRRLIQPYLEALL